VIIIKTDAKKDPNVPNSNEVGFTTKYAELWKFIKFTFAGVSSTIVEVGIFYILQYYVFKSLNTAPLPDNWVFHLLGLTQGKGYLYAYLISTTIGYAIAFVLNRKITFKADSNKTISIILYVIMVIFTILATAWIGTQISMWFDNHALKSLGDVISKPIVTIIPTLWTYPLNRFVIHRKKKQ
jgi:putative flippase GtrA